MTFATVDGTLRFRERLSGMVDSTHFQQADVLWLSSIGLGTYLGDPTDQVSANYQAAIVRALSLGCNVIDTAINYRFQRSERAIGVALKQSAVARDEVFVSTKGGYVPYEGDYPADPGQYIIETYIDTGIAEPEDFAQGNQHCMTPRYLSHQLDQSRANLQLETVDLYYIHNPEGQLGEVKRAQFNQRLLAAFAFLEEAAVSGRIRRYGLATWNGFRQLPTAPDYLSLAEVVALAREVGGDAHHFKAIQLPINLALTEALDHKNQAIDGKWMTPLDAARELGLMVFASAPLLQSRLARNLTGSLRRSLGADLSDAQRALQFARSLPGVTTALAGMSQPAHVDENMALAKRPRFTPEELVRVIR